MSPKTADRTCPRCGATGVRIAYGMPNLTTIEAAERGEVVIGGCNIQPDAPEWECPSCGNAWGQPFEWPT